MRHALFSVSMRICLFAASSAAGVQIGFSNYLGPFGYMNEDRIIPMLGDFAKLQAVCDGALGFGASNTPPRATLTDESDGAHRFFAMNADPFANSSTGEGSVFMTRYPADLAQLTVSRYCTFEGADVGDERGFSGTFFGWGPNWQIAVGAPGAHRVSIKELPAGTSPMDPQLCPNRLDIVNPGLTNFGLRLAGVVGATMSEYKLGVIAFGNSTGDFFGSFSIYDVSINDGVTASLVTTIDGTQAADLWPAVVGTIGDVNGNGFDEFMVGREFRSPSRVALFDGAYGEIGRAPFALLPRQDRRRASQECQDLFLVAARDGKKQFVVMQPWMVARRRPSAFNRILGEFEFIERTEYCRT